MKKKLFVLIIFLGLVIPVFGVSAPGNSPTLMFNTDVARAELYSALGDTELEVNALEERIPFWVDLVNSEDVSEEGEDVYIAVLDTGLLANWPFYFSEADIAASLGKGFTHDIWWDSGIGDIVIGPLRDDRGILTKPFEGSGHGTHVVSTIVGYNYGNLFWAKGVAPKVTIIPVLVLDAWIVYVPGGPIGLRGGTDEMVSAGINYIADLAPSLDGPVIISMSLGGDTPAPMIEEAIDHAIDQGVIVVASAGNEGYAGMGWPGAYPQVISCGMAGWTEQWVDYPARWWLNNVPEKLNKKDYWGNNHQLFLDYGSSRPNKTLGQKSTDLDLSAPGCAIVGPYKPYFSTAEGYYYLWGTSMAAPHVSGISAMILESHPRYSQSKMESVLKNAASGNPLPCDGSLAYDVPGLPYYFTWYGTDYGAGFLMANAALKAAK